MKVFYEKDADLARLEGRTVAILGYGSQGHAHALNLRDSGLNVVVGLRRGSPSCAKAEGEGLKVMTPAEAAAAGDVIMMTLPDETMADIYSADVESNLKAGNYLALAHGFNFHFGCIDPPEGVNCFMVAPKGPGQLNVKAGISISCTISVKLKVPPLDGLGLSAMEKISFLLPRLALGSRPQTP